jgi:hypothetical protein
MLLVAVVGGFLLADGVALYDAHRTADRLAEQLAQEAARAFVATQGDQAAAEEVARSLAAEAGAELVGLEYHKGTTRWFEARVLVRSEGYFLKHFPLLKDRLAWEAAAVVHF